MSVRTTFNLFMGWKFKYDEVKENIDAFHELDLKVSNQKPKHFGIFIDDDHVVMGLRISYFDAYNNESHGEVSFEDADDLISDNSEIQAEIEMLEDLMKSELEKPEFEIIGEVAPRFHILTMHN